MMIDHPSHPAMKGIVKPRPSLTPKARILGNYILKNPRKAVFMTTGEPAETCRVSEATVVRFVSRLGYKGCACIGHRERLGRISIANNKMRR